MVSQGSLVKLKSGGELVYVVLCSDGDYLAVKKLANPEISVQKKEDVGRFGETKYDLTEEQDLVIEGLRLLTENKKKRALERPAEDAGGGEGKKKARSVLVKDEHASGAPAVGAVAPGASAAAAAAASGPVRRSGRVRHPPKFLGDSPSPASRGEEKRNLEEMKQEESSAPLQSDRAGGPGEVKRSKKREAATDAPAAASGASAVPKKSLDQALCLVKIQKYARRVGGAGGRGNTSSSSSSSSSSSAAAAAAAAASASASSSSSSSSRCLPRPPLVKRVKEEEGVDQKIAPPGEQQREVPIGEGPTAETPVPMLGPYGAGKTTLADTITACGLPLDQQPKDPHARMLTVATKKSRQSTSSQSVLHERSLSEIDHYVLKTLMKTRLEFFNEEGKETENIRRRAYEHVWPELCANFGQEIKVTYDKEDCNWSL